MGRERQGLGSKRVLERKRKTTIKGQVTEEEEIHRGEGKRDIGKERDNQRESKRERESWGAETEETDHQIHR